MTYTTLRPTRVYRDDQYAPLLGSSGIADPLAPTFVGGEGALSDDSDDSYVSTFAHSMQGGSIVAMDFAPMTLADPTSYTMFGLTVRLELLLTQTQLNNRVLGPASWVICETGDPSLSYAASGLADFVPTSAPITTPTTYATGNDWYSIPDTIAMNGFTLAFAPAITNETATFEVWRLFEWGLMFDVTAPPATAVRYRRRCRRFPRGD